MPYIIEAKGFNEENPDRSLQTSTAVRAYRTWRGLMMDGYRPVYVITPDGRRFNSFDMAMAEKEDQKTGTEPLRFIVPLAPN